MSNIYSNFGSWGNPIYGGSASAGYNQFPAMASGVPSGSTGGLPASSGFAPIPSSLGSTTSPWGAFTGDTTNFQNIAGLTGSIVPAAESAALPYYQQAIQPYQQLWTESQPGVDQYAASLGLGTPGQQQQAIAAFMASPQMQAQLQLGDAAITAQNAATGGTGSGNELIALDKFNQTVGAQNWGNYLASLQPYLQQRQAAGQGISQGYNTIGGMAYGAPMTALGYLTQDQMAAYNAAAASASAQAGLGSGLLGALGMIGGGLALGSDVNIKENIEPVGKLADDQTIYRYNYKGDPTPRIGLMAQEVEQVAPEAVGDFGGIKGVNYALATNRAAQLMRFANDNIDDSDVPPMVRVYSAGLRSLAA